MHFIINEVKSYIFFYNLQKILKAMYQYELKITNIIKLQFSLLNLTKFRHIYIPQNNEGILFILKKFLYE